MTDALMYMSHQLPHPSHKPREYEVQHKHWLFHCADCDVVYCEDCQREWQNIKKIFKQAAC